MINYRILAYSQEFYEKKGFKIIETPWTVTSEVSNITKPDFVKDEFFMPGKNKTFVGSAEQGFLYLYLKGFLPKGKFQSVSPCMRNDSFDFLHTKYFMKNELIVTDEVTDSKLLEVIEYAKEFFSAYLSKNKLTVDQNDDGSFDINYNLRDMRIELGSYGIRSCEFLDWIYATGCAEPRLSRAMNIQTK